MPRIIIDGLEIEVPQGTKVIDAAERLGIMIPRFCYLKSLGAVGACRMCAVTFLQGPFKGVQMSCMIDVQDGMSVSTTHEEAVAFRKQVIEWLMLNHPHDCPVCDEGGQCLLQDETVSGGHGIRRYRGKKRTYRNQYLGVFIAHEMNRCIHCYRCSRFYQEYCGYRDLGVLQMADRVYFGRFEDGQLESPFSGNLVDLCPTGVYTDIPARHKVRSWDLNRSPSLCIHCSLGCNTVANARHRTVWRVEGRFNEALGSEFICDRGRFGFGHTNHPIRPRRAKEGSSFVSLKDAMKSAAEKLRHIHATFGAQAIACLGSARNSLETQTTLRSFCEGLRLPEPHFFVNPHVKKKVCGAVARLDERVAVSLNQVAHADFVLAVGTDPLNEAPMLALAMRQAQRQGASLVVLDPRPSFLPAPHVHMGVAPEALNGVLGGLVRKAMEPGERENTALRSRGFLQSLPGEPFFRAFSDEQEKVDAVLSGLKKSRNPVLVCGTEVVRESTPSLCADLALLLKEVKGRCGLFYVLPGANAFGSALLSGSGESTFLDVIQSMERGFTKALVLVESDPFVHFPHQERLREAMKKLELLVVLDHLPSLPVQTSQVFLPTSTLFEVDSTFISQEGRVQWSRAVHEGGIPMEQWTGGTHPPRVHSTVIPGRDFRACGEILKEMARIVGGKGKVFLPDPWSFLERGPSAPEAPSRGNRPADGKRLIPRESSPELFPLQEGHFTLREETEHAFELLVVEAVFGTEELSAHSPAMEKWEWEPHMWMHEQDAFELGFSQDEVIGMDLDGGTLEVKLKVCPAMARGVLVLPRHHRLQWQKFSDFSMRVPHDCMRKS